MMVFRLGLFIWNYFTKNRRGAEISQAAMMLVTAILLYLVRAVLVGWMEGRGNNRV